MKGQINPTKLNQAFILTMVIVSLFSLVLLFATPDPVNAGTESLCGQLLYTTVCNAGGCTIGSPDLSCPDNWNYVCIVKDLKVYQEGQEVVGSSYTASNICMPTGCQTTCSN